ncbi:MAG: SRPBCC domain-containing protein, partial [Pseudomonadota bacterium]
MIDHPHALVVRRVIHAPRERIFAAFSRSDLLAQWFTPSAEISLEVLDFNFVAAGRFRLRYNMPDGRRPVVGGSYERIEPPREIILSWIWEAPDPLAGIPMRVLFQFLEKDDVTEVVITH